MSFKKEKPVLKPSLGCLTCGGGEMTTKKDNITYTDKIMARLDTKLIQDFSGVHILKDNKNHYFPSHNSDDWEDAKTLLDFEMEAREEPDSDWRMVLDMPLRCAEYQRQGINEWVLVKTGNGFA